MISKTVRDLNLIVSVIEQFDITREGIVASIAARTACAVCGYRDTAEFENRKDSGSPDVLVMDMDLPGTDTVAYCEYLRLANPLLILIALGASGHASKRAEALRAGANNYLLKPPLISELLTIIHSAARLRRV